MALMSVTPAYAATDKLYHGDISARQLLTMCNQDSTRTLCVSYLLGARSAIKFTQTFLSTPSYNRIYCEPADIKDALADSAAHYVNKVSKLGAEFLDGTNATVMYIALMKEMYPCQ